MNVKKWIENKISILKSWISTLKCWIKGYFLLKNSLEHLENFIKKYYILPIGFNDIYYGNKNMTRFIIFIINWAFRWFAVGLYLSFILSDKMFSLIDVLSISNEHAKLLWLFGTIFLLLLAVFKTDNLLGEINYNLNPYKVIYYLMKDLKLLHKLNEKNYKKLAILSRSIQILIMDCGTILSVIAGTLIVVKIAILSGKIYWIWGIIIFTLIHITSATTTSSIVCLYIIMLVYYTMIFRQINHQFNLISDGKTFFKRRQIIINKTKQRQLISLIHEHNLASIEIHKLNLIIRRSVGCIFITFAMIKIISLYLMVNSNEFFIKLFFVQFNFFMLISGFTLSYLFSLQIKSAHQSLKIVHSIICKCKMKLRLKLKVS